MKTYLDPTGYAAAVEAEAASFWARSRNDLLASLVATSFPHTTSLLEVGCGSGIVLGALRRRLPHVRLVGCDSYPPAVELARARVPGVEIVELDARRLPFRDDFDVVAALDVLEHVDEDEQVLSELHRAVRPGGGLIVAVPQHPALWSAVDEWNLHVRRYTRRELLRKVERAGFEVLRATSFVALLLPAMILARLGRRPDPVAEMTLPTPLERLCAATLRFEQRLIERGLSLPVGGSLVLTGRRR